jgi:signal transduction histidine kinase
MNDVEGRLAKTSGGELTLDAAPSLVAVADELKSPLVLLRQLTFQLEEDIKTMNLAKKQNQATEVIRQMRLTAERTLRLTDSLTKAARLEGAMFSLEPVQLKGLCLTAINEMKPLGQEIGSEIVFRSKRISRVVIGNRELLHALLTGLIDNALHCADGKKVEISAKILHDEAVLSVYDSGSQISLKDFRQLKNSLGHIKTPLSTRPLTSSLGLMIAQKFTTAMNGKLSIQRRSSGGMIFSAHLPTSRQLSLLEL